MHTNEIGTLLTGDILTGGWSLFTPNEKKEFARDNNLGANDPDLEKVDGGHYIPTIVALFKKDGTCEMFDIESLSRNGDCIQLNIRES